MIELSICCITENSVQICGNYEGEKKNKGEGAISAFAASQKRMHKSAETMRQGRKMREGIQTEHLLPADSNAQVHAKYQLRKKKEVEDVN